MAKSKHELQPARSVVDSFGGCRELARILEISPSTVSRWTVSANKRGTNGRVPQRYWKALMTAANRRHIKLTLNDLAGM